MATNKSTHKVLIVDDEANIVTAINFLMEDAGFTTATASDGRQALEVAQAFLPDLIILDVMMPHLDGFEVAAQIRRLPALSQTQIIFLTARGRDRDRASGYSSGGDAYLTKPFDNQALVEMVQEMLEFG